MVTCCGALYPFGIANTSLSRGMSVDGHSDRMKVLVRPQMTWSTENDYIFCHYNLLYDPNTPKPFYPKEYFQVSFNLIGDASFSPTNCPDQTQLFIRIKS